MDNALDGGDVRQDGEDPEDGIRPAEEEERAQAHHALGARQQADFIVESEGFGTRAGV